MIPAAADGAWINAVLFDNGSSIGILGGTENAVRSTGSTTGSIHAPVHQERRLTPSAAAHVYSIRCFVSGGTATINAGTGVAGSDMPAYIRILAATATASVNLLLIASTHSTPIVFGDVILNSAGDDFLYSS
jgi:hypothetical protein